MKRSVFLVWSMLILCVFSLFASRETIRTKGKWGNDRIRTILPKAPEISVDGNILSVYCADPLSDLTITMIDAEGNVILKECVMISSGETVSFTLLETAGVYQIHLNHEYGYLLGDFILY